MQHRFATDVENILTALEKKPLIVLRPTLAQASVAAVSAALPQAKKLALVSDARTHAALGERLLDELSAHYEVQHILLPGLPSPDMETIRHVQQHAADALVAVGSGTINDICKAAAFAGKKPYVVFPTAPSMNGYTSANASVIEDGHKQSFAAAMPAAVLCDMEVIAAAPARMLRAGFGDSMARPTAQADWLLAHLLKGRPYDDRPFALLAPYEPALLKNAGELSRSSSEAVAPRSSSEAVAHLMQILLLSGFGMTLAGGSYPASEGEHMIAHTYEQQQAAHSRHANPARRLAEDWPLHGEQIAVTTLTMARLQEKLLPALPPDVQAKIRAVMLPSAEIEKVLKAVGCPTTPRELGWDEAAYEKAVKQARFSRDRFTFLELA